MSDTWVLVLVFASVSLFMGLCLWGLFEFLNGSKIPVGPVGTTLSLRSKEIHSGVLGEADRVILRWLKESNLPIAAMSLIILALGCCLIVGAVVFIVWEDERLGIGSAIVTLVGLLIFSLVRRVQYREKLFEQLPSTVGTLARAVRSGESIEHAFRSVANVSHTPLATDLGRAAKQLEMGLPMSSALQKIEDTYPYSDVRMMVSSIALHRQYGGDLPATLERLSSVARERADYRRRVKSLTSTPWIAASLIGLAVPVLLIFYAFENDYAQSLWTDRNGQFYLMIALALEIVGVIWLFAVSRIRA